MRMTVFVGLVAVLLSGCGEKQTAAVVNDSSPAPVVQNLSTTDGKRVALVIGNKAYADSPLNNPVNDAEKMAETLRDLGFDVEPKTNLDQKGMKAAIRQFGDSLDSGSVGLFYFSGHGAQVGGKNYLIPVGEDIQREDEVADAAVDVDLVLAKMESARNGLNILILDACRDNPFSRSFRSKEKGLARMDAPTGAVAADGNGPNGLFTSHLLKYLKTPGIDISETLRLTRVGVVQQSEREGKRQVPWESSSLLTRFCFAGCAAQQVAQPAAPVAPAAAPVAVLPEPAVEPSPPVPVASSRAAYEPEMADIPAGSFTMGCQEGRDDVAGGCDSDEKPAHEVTLAAFKMAKTEVTVAQFRAFVGATSYKTTAEEKGSCWSWADGWKEVKGISWRKLGFEQGDDHPVACVSWDDTQAYLKWLNTETGKAYRLPSEAEWEYAARGGKQGAYSWGNAIGQGKANCDNSSCGDKFEYTAPVGSFAANGYGLNDMQGNVWEWCQDWYGSDYYASSPASNPQGAGSGANRVLRGGSWNDVAQSVRSANRDYITPGDRYDDIGFRLVLP
jgi:formylglycine-generating enzyme required for sulfatase activity